MIESWAVVQLLDGRRIIGKIRIDGALVYVENVMLDIRRLFPLHRVMEIVLADSADDAHESLYRMEGGLRGAQRDQVIDVVGGSGIVETLRLTKDGFRIVGDDEQGEEPEMDEEMFARHKREAAEEARRWFQEGFVILDTETTGLNPYVDDIIQIAVIADTGETLFESFVHPTVSISKGAQDVHGITEAMVANAPPFAGILYQLRTVLAGRWVVVWNEAFDVPFLNMAVRKAIGDETLQWQDYCNVPNVVDAMAEYARFHGEWQPRFKKYRFQSLFNACYQQDVQSIAVKAHSAVGDCLRTLAVVKAMAVMTPEERWALKRQDAIEQVSNWAFYTHKTPALAVTGDAVALYITLVDADGILFQIVAGADGLYSEEITRRAGRDFKESKAASALRTYLAEHRVMVWSDEEAQQLSTLLPDLALKDVPYEIAPLYVSIYGTLEEQAQERPTFEAACAQVASTHALPLPAMKLLEIVRDIARQAIPF